MGIIGQMPLRPSSQDCPVPMHLSSYFEVMPFPTLTFDFLIFPISFFKLHIYPHFHWECVFKIVGVNVKFVQLSAWYWGLVSFNQSSC